MMSESGPGTSDLAALNPLDLAASSSSGSDPASAANAPAEDARSSSTEGPDSPGRSSSSSPVPMMIPSSPYHGHAHSSSNGDPGGDYGSSSSGPSYLLPRYHINFTEDVTKDGDVVRYRIKVRKLTDNPEEVIVIERQYEDFEFLHHNLTSKNDISGLIVPPLPPKPALDPKSAEAKSVKQLGPASRRMRGDDFARDCKILEKYVYSLLCHPVFGVDPHMAEFLEHQNPPIRAKIRKGLFSGVRQSLDSRKQLSTRDVDDSFQKERDWANLYGVQLKDACDKFQHVINSQLRLANQISHLATSLNASIGGNEGSNAFYNRLNSRFSGCLEEERKSVELSVANEDKSMGSYLNLWSSYMESENAMLLRRTMLMIEKESSAKAFLKSSASRPSSSKTESLRALQDEKDREFEKCSRMATAEIKRFHQKRLLEMKDTLVMYTEGQISCAKTACDELSKCVMKMRDFPLPTIAAPPSSHPDETLSSTGQGRTSQLNSVSSYTSQ